MRLAILAFAGCGSLPPPGTCDVPTTGTEVIDVVAVPLGGRATFDDLRFSSQLGKLIAPPEGTGQLYVVDPDAMTVDVVDVPAGVGSADANATTIYAADRLGPRLVAFDAESHRQIASGDTPGGVDYVRVAPTTGEVWATIPARNRIEIFDPQSLERIGSVIVPGPVEGLTFDTSGRAYVNDLGAIVAIDVARRLIVGEWDRGCSIPHGFPQIDEGFGLAFGGCFSNGGAGVVGTDGEPRAGFEAGGGEAVLAYDPAKHHLYLRGDPGSTLYMLATCADGELGEPARVDVPDRGHVMSADDRGHVWVADATTGGVLRVTDPFPGSE